MLLDWQVRFKQQYGIHELATQSENLSEDVIAANEICSYFQSVVEREIQSEQIYSICECELL